MAEKEVSWHVTHIIDESRNTEPATRFEVSPGDGDILSHERDEFGVPVTREGDSHFHNTQRYEMDREHRRRLARLACQAVPGVALS